MIMIRNCYVCYYCKYRNRECPHHHHLLLLILLVFVLILLHIILIFHLILILLHILLILLLLLQPDDVCKSAGAEVRGASKSRGGGKRPREGRYFLIVMSVIILIILLQKRIDLSLLLSCWWCFIVSGYQCPSCDCCGSTMRPRESHVNKKTVFDRIVEFKERIVECWGHIMLSIVICRLLMAVWIKMFAIR